VLVNSLESLGFLSVFKAYHQIVSVPEDHDDPGVRISSASDVQCRDRDGWILPCTLFREPIAQHCGTKQKAPGLRRGLLLIEQGSAYRLTWRLAPPLGPLSGVPRTSPLETSLTQSEPSPL
jgi:hypothetical protein